MSLQQTITWIDKTEGRDKFCKAIQYLCRLLKHNSSDKEVAQRFHSVFVGMRDARKLFRLFKSVNEYHKLLGLLNGGAMDPVNLFLNIGTRLGFLLYWLFDNLAILSTIKFLKRDGKGYAKKAAIFWLISLVFSIVQALRQLIGIHQRSVFLKSRSTVDTKNTTELQQLAKQQKTSLLNLIKSLGDMVTASQASEVFPKLTGRNFNDGQIGAAGLTSALITSYQLY